MVQLFKLHFSHTALLMFNIQIKLVLLLSPFVHIRNITFRNRGNRRLVYIHCYNILVGTKCAMSVHFVSV